MQPTHPALTAAAKETLELIQHHREKAPRKLQPLLSYIEAHLFDPDLNVDQLKRACGIRDNSFGGLFQAETGLTPHAYITECRLEIASRLLRDSDVPIWLIGELVGYSGVQVFSRAFCRWSGQRPSAYRKSAQQVAEREVEADADLQSFQFWRKALSGNLATEQARLLIERLRATYLGGETAAVELGAMPARLEIDGSRFETFMAEELWKSIRDLPRENQKSTVRHHVAFSSPALFHLLRKKSRELGRTDRTLGVHLAELAFESLNGCGAEPSALTELRAQGWATIGNARRLELDFPGAEQAFILAEQEWSGQYSRREPKIEAEILQNRAALRMMQRRYEEARDLQERAIPIFRSQGDRHLLAQALILRANIAGYAGDPLGAIPRLKEAMSLLANAVQPSYLAMVGLQSLAAFYALAGDFDSAAEILPRAKSLCEALDNRISHYQLRWIDGLIAKGKSDNVSAEARLREARIGFVELGDMDCAAVVTLDVALLCAEEGRQEEVLALTSEILPVFEALRLDRETLVALGMLRSALESREVGVRVLEKLRGRFHSSLLANQPS